MTPIKEVEYEFSSYNISNLEGKLLTLVEASIGDTEQRKALKDLVRQTLWNWAFENNQGQPPKISIV